MVNFNKYGFISVLKLSTIGKARGLVCLIICCLLLDGGGHFNPLDQTQVQSCSMSEYNKNNNNVVESEYRPNWCK